MFAVGILVVVLCWFAGFGYLFGFFQGRRPVVTLPTDTVLGKFTGGMRYGMLNATWPLATLTVFPYHARLRSMAWRFEFVWNELERVEEVVGGVRFISRSGQRVVFWTYSSGRVVTTLAAAGAPVVANPRKPIVLLWP